MANTKYKTNETAMELRREAGTYVKKLRMKAGLSQLDLSRRLGLDYRGRSLDDMVSAFGGDTCIAAPLPVKRYAGLIPLILGIGECI